ncbi:hypothetical protein [Corallococcus sp. 4LFB]|uniref:hypothetical protein n=1 Tax=Corallococcus sp. 4LFB TaxID=3383249 RepID=UPI003974C93F
MRHAANRDGCESEVVKALQAEGWGVWKLSAKDFPDLLCVRQGQVLLVECKKLGGALRPGQAKLHAALHALGFLVGVAGDAVEARSASVGAPVRTYLTMPVEERGTRGPRGVRLAGGPSGQSAEVAARRRLCGPRLSPGSSPTTRHRPTQWRPRHGRHNRFLAGFRTAPDR